MIYDIKFKKGGIESSIVNIQRVEIPEIKEIF